MSRDICQPFPDREADANSRGKCAGLELSLIKLHQQRRLAYTAVPHQDRLQRQENTSFIASLPVCMCACVCDTF